MDITVLTRDEITAWQAHLTDIGVVIPLLRRTHQTTTAVGWATLLPTRFCLGFQAA
ncbi:MAG: hypothetical protein IK065_04180 [Neisseriaceae bacterium]|nr:hypothetical protein [Neisseriaceae bacterium]